MLAPLSIIFYQIFIFHQMIALQMARIENVHGFVMSLFKIGWVLFSNAKETLQKMLARNRSYRGKHMKDLK